LDTIGILTVSGLILYCVNYLTGWLLHFKVITLTKLTHQVIFILLLTTMILLLYSLDFLSNKFLLYTLSFTFLLALPLGRKGGKYHTLVSSAGLLLFLLTMLNYQFFKYFE
jgi:hypothetical protein